MHIVYIHQHFRHPDEGGGTRSWEFAKRLVTDGHTVTIISGVSASDGDDFRDGVRIIRLPIAYSNSMNSTQRIAAFLRFVLRATATALRSRGDVFLATSTPLTVAIPALVASKLRRKRFVFEVRDLWPSVPVRLGIIRSRATVRIAQRLERSAYWAADHIIALSPSMREGVLQVAPLASVSMVPNAADRDLFSFSVQERQTVRSRLDWTNMPVIIYAGSFGHTYRIPWVVELASRCPSMQFHIIGDGASSREARELARSRGLDPARLLPGHLPKDEVARRVSAADLVMSSLENHPALHGNSLNKVFDAMAAGRPVVFNHDGWLSEMMVRRGAGWRLDDDLDAAAHQLEAIVSSPDALSLAAIASSSLGEEFDRDLLYAQFSRAVLGSAQADGAI